MDVQLAETKRRILLEKLQGEDALLLKVVEAIPDDKLDWKPDVEKCWVTNELAWHMAGAGYFFLGSVTGEGMDGDPPPAPVDKRALLEAIRQTQAHYRAAVAAMPVESLAADVDFMGQTVPAIDILSWHPDHVIHHRAQLALYLRLMGAQVPATYGPSGDEGFGDG